MDYLRTNGIVTMDHTLVGTGAHSSMQRFQASGPAGAPVLYFENDQWDLYRAGALLGTWPPEERTRAMGRLLEAALYE